MICQLQKLLFCFLIGFFAVNCANAQSTLGANILGGYLISHHPEMQNLEAHIAGIELRKQWTGERSTAPFKDAILGLSGMYINLGKPDIAGSVYAIIPHLESKLFIKNNHKMRVRYGVGIGYVTKPFSYPNNIKNKAIGSHLNGSMQLMLDYDYQLSPQLIFHSGFGMIHFSNANVKKPNLGINMPHLAIGLHLIPKKLSDQKFKMNLNHPVLNKVSVFGAYSSKQINIDDPKRVNIYTLAAEYVVKKRDGHCNRFGTDFFFDYSYPYQNFHPQSLENVKLTQILEHAIRAGHEWRLGKVGALVDIGAYTYRPQKLKRRYYFSVGFMYYPTEKIQMFVKLKTHLAVADYFAWGIGYAIYEKK